MLVSPLQINAGRIFFVTTSGDRSLGISFAKIFRELSLSPGLYWSGFFFVGSTPLGDGRIFPTVSNFCFADWIVVSTANAITFGALSSR